MRYWYSLHWQAAKPEHPHILFRAFTASIQEEMDVDEAGLTLSLAILYYNQTSIYNLASMRYWYSLHWQAAKPEHPHILFTASIQEEMEVDEGSDK